MGRSGPGFSEAALFMNGQLPAAVQEAVNPPSAVVTVIVESSQTLHITHCSKMEA